MEQFILRVRDENGNFVGIPAIKGDPGSPDAITFTPQELNEAQQAQARSNIGAGTSSFSGNYRDLSGAPSIPAKLPNPKAITFTGAVTGTYDGSTEATIDIPQGGGGGKMEVVYAQLGMGEGPLEPLIPKGNTIYAYMGSSETPIDVVFASSALGGYSEVGQTIIFEAPSELAFNFLSEDMGGICRMDGYSDLVGDSYSFFKYTVLIGYNGIYIDRKKFNN